MVEWELTVANERTNASVPTAAGEDSGDHCELQEDRADEGARSWCVVGRERTKPHLDRPICSLESLAWLT